MCDTNTYDVIFILAYLTFPSRLRVQNKTKKRQQQKQRRKKIGGMRVKTRKGWWLKSIYFTREEKKKILWMNESVYVCVCVGNGNKAELSCDVLPS